MVRDCIQKKKRFHKQILCSAVFTWTNLLVVVAELDGGENEALDLVPLVTNVVLEVDWISSNFFHLHLGRNNPHTHCFRSTSL